ncbi:MAG: hypothetical protein E6K41_08785 [Gammaproteobacteria bacterium]|nr:MAG: hypothetical protein E6K41_08785 [Gammaproteobacteria bacterium]
MQRLIIPLLAALSAAAPAAAAGAAQPACATGQAAAPALARLRTALAHGRFVTYQPTALTVSDGRIVSADAASIRADLSVLRPRFDSLVTYDAIHGAEEIPAIAAALRFRALIIGVWNPLDEAELRAAGDAVRRHPDLVVGLSLGNATCIRSFSRGFATPTTAPPPGSSRTWWIGSPPSTAGRSW